MVAVEEDAQVDRGRDHKIVRKRDQRVKQKSRNLDQSRKLAEALASRTESPTQRLLPREAQVAARVAQGRADGAEAGDAAVVAQVEALEEVAAAAGKTVEKEGTSLVQMPGQLLER